MINLATGQRGVHGGKKVTLDTPEAVGNGQYRVFRPTNRKDNKGNVIAREIIFTPVVNKARFHCELAKNPDKTKYWACHGLEILNEIKLEKELEKEKARQQRLKVEAENRAKKAKEEAEKQAEEENE